MKRIVLFFAVKQEAAPFCRQLRNRGWMVSGRRERHYFGHSGISDVILEVILTGMGRAAVNKVLEQLGEYPDLLITAGFCGALDPMLRVGDVVRYAVRKSEPEEATVLPFHCAAQTICKASEKEKLWISTGCRAVEMESGHVVEFCRKHGIPVTVIRTVSDTADSDMPLDFNKLTLPNGKLSASGLAWKIVQNPLRIFGLIGLGIHSGRAAKALAGALLEELKGEGVDKCL